MFYIRSWKPEILFKQNENKYSHQIHYPSPFIESDVSKYKEDSSLRWAM